LRWNAVLSRLLKLLRPESWLLWELRVEILPQLRLRLRLALLLRLQPQLRLQPHKKRTKYFLPQRT
jgi:hypothetical protein